jgi:hypothetical protein
MRISKSATYAVSALVAASLLAACSGSNSGMQSSGLTPSGGTDMARGQGASPLHHGAQDAFIAVHPYGAPHPNHRKSWISPDAAKAPRLFFAADSGEEEVNIYTMPGMSLKGQITGLDEPQGECSDSKGNVYVDNTGSTQVLEYSRTGTLLNTYTDSYGYPVGCSVDPATGNLAVSNIFGFSGAGQVLVFSSPSAQPTVLSNPSQYYYYFVGYGPGSNLWVSGKDSSGLYRVSGCSTTSCSTINLTGGTIYFPGNVQWDNVRSTWVLWDQLCNDSEAACSYPVSASGALGTPTDYLTYAGGDVCDMVQGIIAANGKNYVAGGDYEYCGTASSTFDRWGYTGGGEPTNYATVGAYSIPDGAAISTK